MRDRKRRDAEIREVERHGRLEHGPAVRDARLGGDGVGGVAVGEERDAGIMAMEGGDAAEVVHVVVREQHRRSCAHIDAARRRPFAQLRKRQAEIDQQQRAARRADGQRVAL